MAHHDRFDPLEDLDVLAHKYAQACDGADALGRQQLREAFMRAVLPLAGRIASRYRGRGEPVDDLVQVARLGLVKAVDRYDPERGSFTAYAILTVTGEIKRHFRDHTWDLHVPRGQQDRVLEFARTRAELTSELARVPTVAELARRLGVDESQVIGAPLSAAAHRTDSLNTRIGQGMDSSELGDLIGGPDVGLTMVDDRTTMEGLMCELPIRERQLLALRFWGNLSQAEIAEELGVSQMHVSRLLSRTLTWLRQAMLSDSIPPWTGSGGPERRVTILAGPVGATAVVHGEVDRDNAHRIRRDLLTAAGRCGQGQQLIVDLSGVPLLGAAGIGTLTSVCQAASRREVKVVVTGAQPFVAQVLIISGLRDLLDDAAAGAS